jgi:2,3-bisphosphoglycerate-independent phosphoglycerate mutase
MDGVGVGVDDAEANPFFTARLPVLSSMFGNHIPSINRPYAGNTSYLLVSLDANLGVAGLPQSGTGQTALFTGVNAAKHIGKHFGPYPFSTLRPIIKERNIFRRTHAAGRTFTFANAYPRQFFEYVESGKRRLTVTTLACLESGLPLHTAEDLRRGNAISADITNERWAALGYPDIAPITPAEAGNRFGKVANNADLSLFEYFLTDHAGHARDMEQAVRVLERFDAFLGGVCDAIDDSVLLVITSDHGNVEDLRVKTHTRNAVPLWLFGKDANRFGEGVTSITDVAPRIMDWLTIV